MEIHIENYDCVMSNIHLDLNLEDYSFSLNENNKLSSLDINVEADLDQKVPYIYVKMSPGE